MKGSQWPGDGGKLRSLKQWKGRSCALAHWDSDNHSLRTTEKEVGWNDREYISNVRRIKPWCRCGAGRGVSTTGDC